MVLQVWRFDRRRNLGEQLLQPMRLKKIWYMRHMRIFSILAFCFAFRFGKHVHENLPKPFPRISYCCSKTNDVSHLKNTLWKTSMGHGIPQPVPPVCVNNTYIPRTWRPVLSAKQERQCMFALETSLGATVREIGPTSCKKKCLTIFTAANVLMFY